MEAEPRERPGIGGVKLQSRICCDRAARAATLSYRGHITEAEPRERPGRVGAKFQSRICFDRAARAATLS